MKWLGIQDYNSISHRNNKKDELHLNKHILHLVRLFLMGTEIMQGEGVHTFREKDHDLLMDLRNGVYVKDNTDGSKDYSYIFELVDKLEKNFNYACENSPLPKNPDYKKVEELLITIYKEWLHEC